MEGLSWWEAVSLPSSLRPRLLVAAALAALLFLAAAFGAAALVAAAALYFVVWFIAGFWHTDR